MLLKSQNLLLCMFVIGTSRCVTFLFKLSLSFCFHLFLFLSPEWSSHFHPRNLIALTAEPLLLYPTHYVGDKGYFSDTETTAYIPPEDNKKDEL